MNCPTCGQSTDTISAEIVNKLVDWDDYDYAVKGDSTHYDGLGFVELTVEPKGKDYDSYGGILEEDVFVVVRIDDRLFKKEGTRSSYGSLYWDGECREVKAEPRIVTVFDYV